MRWWEMRWEIMRQMVRERSTTISYHISKPMREDVKWRPRPNQIKMRWWWDGRSWDDDEMVDHEIDFIFFWSNLLFHVVWCERWKNEMIVEIWSHHKRLYKILEMIIWRMVDNLSHNLPSSPSSAAAKMVALVQVGRVYQMICVRWLMMRW